MSTQWISAEEAQLRLGVKLQTLYAYTSRGLITVRQDAADSRRSLYAAEDIGRLLLRKARRYAPDAPSSQRRAEPPGPAASSLTTLSGGVLRYRDRDVAELAETASLEEVARLLWACEEDSFSGLVSHPLMISGSTAKSRIFALLAYRAAHDPAATGREDKALKREAASVMADLVDAAAGAPRSLALHDRLARSWRMEGPKADAIRRMLVLAADQAADEVSNSAARIAASTGASPAASALAGLAAFSGPKSGGGTSGVLALVSEVRRAASAEQVFLQRRSQGLEAAGFGAAGFPEGDPRAEALKAALRWSDEMKAIAEAGEAVMGRRVNFDFALVASCRTLGLPADAPGTLMTAARTVGWLAHALEQRASGLQIKPRVRQAATEEQAANDAAA